VKIPRLFFDLNGLDAKTILAVGTLGTTRAVGVFRSLKAQGISMSYAGVVKRLKTMCSQGLLAKKGLTYSVNVDWISEMKDIFGDLGLFLDAQGGARQIPQSGCQAE